MATAAHGAGARRTAATTRVILASSLAWFMVTLDFFAAQTALPAMAADLDTTVTTLQWVISGYMLTMSSFFIVGGRLGDIVGRRTLFLIGVTIFGTTSLLGGMSVNATMVITSRILQGVGSAIMVPAAMSVVTNAVASDRVQRSIGMVLAVGAVGQALGPSSVGR